MKLKKDQLDVLANNVYNKIEELTEWKAVIENAKEETRKYTELFKLTQDYNSIKVALEMKYIEDIYTNLYKIFEDLFELKSNDRFPIPLNKDNFDRQIYNFIYDIIKPDKISTREIKERIVLDSIKINKEETVDEFVIRIAKSFFNS
jgi:hypothetical protein